MLSLTSLTSPSSQLFREPCPCVLLTRVKWVLLSRVKISLILAIEPPGCVRSHQSENASFVCGMAEGRQGWDAIMVGVVALVMVVGMLALALVALVRAERKDIAEVVRELARWWHR